MKHAYLEHEIWDHSVEDTALVVKRLLADGGITLLTYQCIWRFAKD
jgi:hypothetical protein